MILLTISVHFLCIFLWSNFSAILMYSFPPPTSPCGCAWCLHPLLNIFSSTKKMLDVMALSYTFIKILRHMVNILTSFDFIHCALCAMFLLCVYILSFQFCWWFDILVWKLTWFLLTNKEKHPDVSANLFLAKKCWSHMKKCKRKKNLVGQCNQVCFMDIRIEGWITVGMNVITGLTTISWHQLIR